MFNRDSWIEILQTILKNPLRYILTGISVAVGIFILVFLLGISAGLTNGAASMFGKIAINSMSLDTGRTSLSYQGTKPNRRIDFSNYDFTKIKTDHKDEIPFGSAFERIWGIQMNWGNESGNYSLAGSNSSILELLKLDVLQGRFLNMNDENEAKKSVVIGVDVYKELCKEGEVVGTLISIGGVQFKIVGVFKRGENRWNNRRCFIPIQTFHKLFSPTDRIDEFYLSTGDLAVSETVELEEELMSFLQTRHKVNPEDDNAITTNNNNVENAKYANIGVGIKAFVFVIGLMTLVSGIIGISNIMSIVVKERTRELGIRKALGATPSKIIGLILQESLLITVLSGFLGMIAGILVLELVSYFIELEYFKNPSIDFNSAMTALFILIVSGVISGLVPAVRAARLRPIVALRDE
jgi:putative ABC transport system permease protein